MIGESILHYRIIEKISEGGMGIVYKAEDLKLDRVVALKFLPYKLRRNPSENKRFIYEAKALAILNHPNVATIYGIEEFEEKSFIVMEFIEGHDLREILKDAKKSERDTFLPIATIINYSIQIVQGLSAAHKKNIVHRDIKPENIIINTHNNIKILDFGLAKITGREHLTTIGTTVGTVAYMSPEQTRADPVDHRTDIWSVGVILYEMISGKRPFRGDYEQAIIYSILNENPEPLGPNYPHVPEKLEKIVFKTLAKNPADRYNNCEDLIKDLQYCFLPINHDAEIKIQTEIPQKTARNLNWFLKSLKMQLRIFWKIILAILILSAAYLYIIYPKYHQYKSFGKKIAVLPFINLGDDLNDEYFSDGIMEDILTQLVKISDLKVISRTTMMRYKNTTKTMEEISKELNTDIVLEGSVRRDSNLLRISVQLIDAKNDEHLWAESYDRNVRDVFDVQSQIANQIASTLRAELSPRETEGLHKVAATNPEAYSAFLQGRFFLEKRTRENVDKAISYFKQSLAIDSNYAQAWVGLSQSHSIEADMGFVPLNTGYQSARIEAEKALKLDPNLAEAFARLAWIKMTYNWDWNGADEDYKHALKIEPGNAAIIQSAGVLASVLGRIDKAIELSKRAIELNPLLSTPHYNLGLHYYYAHQWEMAKTSVQAALDINSQYPAAHVLLGRIYLAESKPKGALSEMQKELEIAWRRFGLILVYHALGKTKEEDTALAEFIRDYQYDSAYQIAEIYSFRDDMDNTFLWLERAYQQRDGGLGDIKGDPLMDNIEKDPRYAMFMKKMNLPI